MSDPSATQGKAQAITETITGVVLMGTPWWSGVLADVNLIATTIAAICGAIIGVAGVFTLVRRRTKRLS